MNLTLSDLNATDVLSSELTLADLITATYPTIATKQGTVLRDLLIRPNALFYTYNNTNLTDLTNSYALALIAADPDNADSTVLDAIGSNYGLVRLSGETNAGFCTRISIAISAPNVCSRASILSLLEANYSVTAGSAIGLGDAEMQRDRSNLFNVSLGNKSDVHIKKGYPTQVDVTSTCTNVSGTTYQCSLTRTDAGGVYRVLGIYTTDGTLITGTTTVTRGLDLTGVTDIHTVPTTALGGFSAYQTMVVRFISATDPGTSVIVRVEKVPDISTVQTYMDSAEHPLGDYLVKGATPAYLTSIIVTIKVPTGVTQPDSTALKTAITNYINSYYGFVYSLSSDPIVAACSSLLTGGAYIASTTYSGTIYLPDDTTANITTITTDRSAMGVSYRTIGYYTATTYINISFT